MAFKFLDSFQGYPATDANFTPATATPGLFPFTPGQYAQVESYDFGGAEFIYARANGAIPVGSLCSLLPVFDTTQVAYRFNAVVAPSTALLGNPLCVYVGNTALTAGQYAFFAISGVVPVLATATVVAGASVGLGTSAGSATGTIVASKQILNAVGVAGSAGTIVKAGATGLNGDTKINVPNTNGLFVGATLSGTGVGAGTIASIDPAGTFVVSTAANTAAVSGNLTATFTGFIMVYINRPFGQGAIT
jgi:hypothetical protein